MLRATVCVLTISFCVLACGDDDGGVTAVCGNDRAEGDEECDGIDLDGLACSDLGFNLGTLACAADCSFDRSACSICGDGVIDAIEACDDGASNSDGTPDACRTDCRPARCGDGTVDTAEACDDGANNSDLVPDACRADCSLPHCGDGVVDPLLGELCDDGNGFDGDGCNSSCLAEFCGNGALDPGELCDDGNHLGGDGCSHDCRSDETCGNGIVDFEAGEQCDCGTDPANVPAGCNDAINGDPASPCTANCETKVCGDGNVTAGELCDDGNTISGDGCSADCLSDETCGNSIVDLAAGESCDDGNIAPGDGCNAFCQTEFCGNGTLDPGEVCDDGNPIPGDGCSADCQSTEVCGNGITDVLGGETCDCGTDPGNLPAGCTGINGQPGSNCSVNCVTIFCGNGQVEPGELCDDGNNLGGDGCSADCQSSEVCGNGITDFVIGETCDDGNVVAGDGCGPTCRIEICGNGTLDPGEICDDGNFFSGDGCSADCQSDEICGNGYIDFAVGEQCDDGNTSAGDGCSATCQAEALPGTCGDGVVNVGEICDDNNTGSPADDVHIPGMTCALAASLAGTTWTGSGLPGCNGTCDGFVASSAQCE